MTASAARVEIRRVLAALWPGEVVSYGDIAHTAGHPGRARFVGRILAESDDLPWWRVVDASGRLVPGAEDRQRELLEAEGAMPARRAALNVARPVRGASLLTGVPRRGAEGMWRNPTTRLAKAPPLRAPGTSA